MTTSTSLYNKTYYDKHRESLLQDKKVQYQLNKDYYTNYWKQQMSCDICNKTFSISNRYKHLNSKKHNTNLNQHTLNNENTLVSTCDSI
jgi:hypothetical protein